MTPELTLETQIIQKLRSKSILLCTVESCTGGLIAHQLTQISGASDVFWGSWVTYDNSAKLQLGVSAQSLSLNGAVSREVALELATSGVRAMAAAIQQFSSHSRLRPHRLVAVSTTGVAGPSGGSVEKPVGLCFTSIASVAVAAPLQIHSQVSQIQTPPGFDRIQNQTYFARKALEALLSLDLG